MDNIQHQFIIKADLAKNEKSVNQSLRLMKMTANPRNTV
jgi:hypothetical protein